MSAALDRIGRETAAHLDEMGPELDVDHGLDRFREEVDRQRLASRRPRAFTWSVAAAVFTLLLGFSVYRSGIVAAPLDVRLERGGDANAWIEGADEAQFSDGSVVTTEPRSRWRVATTTSRGATVQLERGSLTARVVHRDDTTWRVDAGPFAIDVTGTAFTTTWDPTTQQFALTMHEGTVVLSGPRVGGELIVSAPRRVQIDLSAPMTEAGSPAAVGPKTSLGRAAENSARATESRVAEASDGDPRGDEADDPAHVVADPEDREGAANETPPSSAVSPPTALAPRPSGSSSPGATSEAASDPSPPAWRDHAAARRYGEAVAAVRALGVAAVLQGSGPADLLQLAQVARLGGAPQLARRALRRLATAHAGSVEARTARFLEGRVHFDGGRPSEAAAAFADYLRSAPSGAFAGEARVLLILALDRSGRREEARQRARRYLERNPNSPAAGRLQTFIDP
ncbi:MAG: FecR domain-containing protein [Myxococcota bacterium]